MTASDAVMDGDLREAAALRERTLSKFRGLSALGWDSNVESDSRRPFHVELPDGSFECEGRTYKEPYKVLNAGLDGAAILVQRAQDNGEVVLKIASEPNMDFQAEHECEMMRQLEGVEHIVRCEATCVPSTGKRVIITVPFVRDFGTHWGSVDKIKVNGKQLTPGAIDNAAETTLAVAFDMLKKGIINADQGHNILYESNGTPTFIDFGRAVDLKHFEYPAKSLEVQEYTSMIVDTFIAAVMWKLPLSWWQRDSGKPCIAMQKLLGAPCPPDHTLKCSDAAWWKEHLKQVVARFEQQIANWH